MHQIARTLALLLSIIFFSGCASGWKLTSTRFKNSKYFFAPPPRWMITEEGSSAILSCHGPSLDKILIICHKVSDPFPFTNLRANPEMLPHELGEIIISRIIAAPQVSNVMLLDESISQVDNRPSVKLAVDYRINGIQFTDLIYAFIDGLFLYELRYTAAKRHYYQQNLNIFETVVKSFKVR